MTMKRLIAAVLVWVLLTGCSHLPDDVVSEIEKGAESFKEDFKSEVVDAIKDEFLDEVSQKREEVTSGPTVTPEPVEEEKMTGDGALMPTIKYRGVTYSPYMTVTAEELYEWIPDLEKIDTTQDEDWTFGSWSDSYYIRVLPWEEARSSPARASFLDQYTYGDPLADRCLWTFIIAKDGAASNGVYIGDSAEKVLQIFPEADIDANSFTVFFYDGKVISSDEYRNMRPSPTDIDLEREFEWKYDVYVVHFFIQDGAVSSIGIYNNYAWIKG